MKEIEVPKNLRQFMLEGAEETNLGDKKGAKKQFRYGNLHIVNMMISLQFIQIKLILEKIH